MKSPPPKSQQDSVSPDLQWSDEAARAVLDTIADAIITIDSRGIVQSANRATAAVFGYEQDELLGQPVALLMPADDAAVHDSHVRRYLDTGKAGIIGIGRELIGRRKGGVSFPMYLAISESRVAGEQYFTGIVRDLSERRAAEQTMHEQRERLSQVARLSVMGEMTASISHEINQPLAAVSVYAQACLRLLQGPEPDLERLQEALLKLNDQSLRAGAVVERLQNFMHGTGGGRQLLDVNETIVPVQALISADAAVHGVQLTFDLHDELPMVRGDAVQIQQVALNLLRNAIDAMQEIACCNGRLAQVTTSAVESADGTGMRGVEVAVIDAGPGIAATDIESIFEAFHTTKIDGLGLGLSICRNIVAAHGGHMNFTNNPKHGCTFTFFLPSGDVNER